MQEIQFFFVYFFASMLLTMSWKSQKLKKLPEMRKCEESQNPERSSNLSLHKNKMDAIHP